MTNFHIGWTLVLLVVFVGIFIWAWSAKRKGDFAEAARLPLERDNPTNRSAEGY